MQPAATVCCQPAFDEEVDYDHVAFTAGRSKQIAAGCNAQQRF
jgi:hypothetical protein